MPTTISVRLDSETEELVARLAERRSQTKSEVIRQALVLLAQTDASESTEGRPYDTLAHLIGCVSGGPPELSAKTGQKLRDILDSKAKRNDGSR